LDVAGVESATLVGASFGGQISIDFAMAHPGRVARLVLAAPALGGYEWSEQVQHFGGREDALLEAGDIDAAVELNLELWVDGPRREPGAVPAAVRSFVGEMQRNVFEIPLAAFEQEDPPMPIESTEAPAATRLGEIQAPTLVLVGDEDVSDFLEIAERIGKAIPRARKVVIPGAAHLLSLERPEEFADHLIGCLKEPGSRN
jgi:pimeloyl-ACP methyl ester carboxylesterase